VTAASSRPIGVAVVSWFGHVKLREFTVGSDDEANAISSLTLSGRTLFRPLAGGRVRRATPSPSFARRSEAPRRLARRTFLKAHLRIGFHQAKQPAIFFRQSARCLVKADPAADVHHLVLPRMRLQPFGRPVQVDLVCCAHRRRRSLLARWLEQPSWLSHLLDGRRPHLPTRRQSRTNLASCPVARVRNDPLAGARGDLSTTGSWAGARDSLPCGPGHVDLLPR
jgi:hypothetical protein